MKSNLYTIKSYSLLLMFLLATVAFANDHTLVLPSIISDHAVFQRNAECKLWGWYPGDRTLKIVPSWSQSDTIKVRADKSCAWSVKVSTPEDKGPHRLLFYDEYDTLLNQVDDVLMGETWLCSGQSNMEYKMEFPILDAPALSLEVDVPDIRFFKVNKFPSNHPVERIGGEWVICSPETYKDFSAVAFFFGQCLFQKLDSPIGLIGSYWGGSSIEPWIDVETYKVNTKAFELSKKNQLIDWSPTANAVINNGMISPITNYRLAGVIWYQGEANVMRPNDYGVMLEAMVEGWRRQFEHDLPFYYVQIAPWSGYSAKNAALLREQQYLVSKSLKNGGMINISDLVNDIDDIHPGIKKQVGLRLANLALLQTYDQKEVSPLFPEMKTVELKGNKALVEIDVEGELVFPDKESVKFEVVDHQGKIYPAIGKLQRKKNIIEVSAKGVSQVCAVRYCFTNDAIPDVFGANGLPLLPFRTDKN